MSISDEKESFFEDMYANYPEKFNPDWEIYAKQEWLGTNLRCDVIYKSKSDCTLHLVEIKRNFADFPNIAQVMEYYAELDSKNINIDKVYILAQGFSEELRVAMEYCNISPLQIDIETIDKIKEMTVEEIEGIYAVSLEGISHMQGEFPELPEGISEEIKLKFESYKKNLISKPQSHFFEIWEFKFPRKGQRPNYILSIKHNGELFLDNHLYEFMQGKSRSIDESTRNSAWEFYKKNCMDKPYKNLIIRSYDPIRSTKNLVDTKRKIDNFLREDVNPNIH
ncbi:hypothetical protein [Peribacillus sp. AS_2]|uniref:hypothetical protein n=1 Tax=Peribacillus sp. AS_2 TaxID=2996755 RepID=UPI0022A670F1|nr:hypothetical protein [Peribacillus sp. AS_2]MCZ0872769.1 hypothetical protein [Peribacillus sp. AS_2]